MPVHYVRASIKSRLRLAPPAAADIVYEDSAIGEVRNFELALLSCQNRFRTLASFFNTFWLIVSTSYACLLTN